MSELDDFIDQVLSPSSKAELVESVKDNIGLAEKCLIVLVLLTSLARHLSTCLSSRPFSWGVGQGQAHRL
jgi:hypothetical protein